MSSDLRLFTSKRRSVVGCPQCLLHTGQRQSSIAGFVGGPGPPVGVDQKDAWRMEIKELPKNLSLQSESEGRLLQVLPGSLPSFENWTFESDFQRLSGKFSKMQI